MIHINSVNFLKKTAEIFIDNNLMEKYIIDIDYFSCAIQKKEFHIDIDENYIDDELLLLNNSK